MSDPIEDRFAQIAANFEKVHAILAPLAATVAAHDSQIEGLINVAEKHEKVMENLQKEWQAYLRRLPPA